MIDSVTRNVDYFITDNYVLGFMGVDLLVGQKFTELNDIQYSRKGMTFSDHVVDRKVNLIENSVVNVGLENPKAVNTLLKLYE